MRGPTSPYGATLFDFRFMHRARVSGPDGGGAVQRLTPRPVVDLPPGRIRYALRLDEAGYARADLTVWRIDDRVFEVYSGRADEISQLREAASSGAVVDDLTTETEIGRENG